MSNSSSFKNVPPVFQNITADKVWKTLRDPFAIAILASLGVHGLLWFGLPLIPSSNSKPTDDRTLNVIELSPLEQQARLPNPAPLQTSPLVPNLTSPKLSIPGVPTVPSSPTVADPNTYYQIPDTSSRSTTITTKREPAKTTRKTQKEENQPKSSDDAKSPSDEPTPDKNTSSAGGLTGSDGKPPEKSREDLEKLKKLFTFNATGTSDQEVRSSMISANDKISEKFGEKFGTLGWEKPISITAPYPKEACQAPLYKGKFVQGETGLTVVMLPDGKLDELTSKFKPSGFDGLDNSAIDFVKKKWDDIVKQAKLEPGSKPKVFNLEIKIAPTAEDCPKLEKPAT